MKDWIALSIFICWAITGLGKTLCRTVLKVIAWVFSQSISSEFESLNCDHSLNCYPHGPFTIVCYNITIRQSLWPWFIKLKLVGSKKYVTYILILKGYLVATAICKILSSWSKTRFFWKKKTLFFLMSLPSLILSFLSFLQLATGFVTKIFRSNYALLSHVIRNYKMLPLVHIAFDKKDNHHRGPLFFLPLTLWFCYENRFIKCSLILSSETLTLLYFALGIRSQCCMLHALKSEAFTREGEGGGGKAGGLGPVFLNFLDPRLTTPLFRILWAYWLGGKTGWKDID